MFAVMVWLYVLTVENKIHVRGSAVKIDLNVKSTFFLIMKPSKEGSTFHVES